MNNIIKMLIKVQSVTLSLGSRLKYKVAEISNKIDLIRCKMTKNKHLRLMNNAY